MLVIGRSLITPNKRNKLRRNGSYSREVVMVILFGDFSLAFRLGYRNSYIYPALIADSHDLAMDVGECSLDFEVNNSAIYHQYDAK